MAPPGLGTLGQPHSKKTPEFRSHERESWLQLQLAWKKLNLVIVEQLDEEHHEEEEEEEEERRRRRIDNDREGLVASAGK